MKAKKASRIFDILNRMYRGSTTALNHHNAFELLAATIMSAQCTDQRVNLVTRGLFKKYRSIDDFAKALPAALESDIRSTGFFRNKARNIISAARMIKSDFGGKVPQDMESLIRLPGVARKTANIVLFHAFGKSEGIAVDTHVKRVSFRLGFTEETDPVKIEKDLMGLFDRSKWGKLSNLLIAHGRKICNARKPLCHECQVFKLCRSGAGSAGR